MNPIHSRAEYDRLIQTGKIAMIGLGVSHRELAAQLLSKGADLTVLDQNADFADRPEQAALKTAGLKFFCGDSYLSALADYDLILRSPGVKWHLPALAQARANQLPVTSEMELFFTLCPAPVYGVTGSDGKTTSTTLISEFLKAAGKRVFLGGNIGAPLLSHLDEISKDDCIAAELSSFQLMGMEQSASHALITNLAPNHLDWHKDMAEYAASKRNLFLHQPADGVTVLNEDNAGSMSYAPFVPGRLLTFSRTHKVENGAFLREDGMLCLAENGKETPLFQRTEIRLRGEFNVENMLGAIAMTASVVSTEQFLSVARAFGGVQHRNETVRVLNGVEWINDSIASSPTRTNAGLTLYDKKIILIAGGYDKKIPYAPLAAPVLQHVKRLILMGDTAPAIEKAVTEHPDYAASGLLIDRVNNMEEAVALAAGIARAGDIVKLSPASASFGLYRNFEERGAHFRRLVSAL